MGYKCQYELSQMKIILVVLAKVFGISFANFCVSGHAIETTPIVYAGLSILVVLSH